MFNSKKKMVPKNLNGTFLVHMVGRVSTLHQNIENIEASFEPLRGLITELCDGEVEIKKFGEQGSGMIPNRESIRACEDEIDRGIVDLVVMEDLARAHRNIQYSTGFVFNAVDQDTRVIATGDGLDTADENWESILIAAASRHGMTVPEARRRVKRTAD